MITTVYIDHYKRGQGTIQKFNNLSSKREAENFIEKWCKENNHHIVSKEWCDNSYWNYLEDGSEIDFTIECYD